jgi:3-isopropylmalate/(R)-2-methylmalate dehydratase large subunit
VHGGREQGFTLRNNNSLRRQPYLDTVPSARWRSISTSEVEHARHSGADQRTCWCVDGTLPDVTAKDIILAIIGEIGTAGGNGHVIEYAGEAISALSMEGRMTICNMSIEGGARAGLIAPDAKTIDYIKGRPRAPKGGAFEVAKHHWEQLYTDEGAHFDRIVGLKANELPPIVSWGTSPEQVVSISGRVPVPSEIADETKRKAAERSLDYMGEGRREDHRRSTACSSAPAPMAASVARSESGRRPPE